MKQFVNFFVFMLIFVKIFGQNEQKTSIKFSGFVKTDVFYDTRQTSSTNGLREGHFYLFPDSILLSKDSIDINDKDVFHILSIQTRLRANITGPDALGAKTSGLVETEFFGTSEADLNGLRLRHAYLKLNWKKTELLIGQNWHPMFPVHAIPGTISFNTGAPFIAFSRNPQVKVSHTIIPLLSINLTAFSERDFPSTGPDGLSNKYIRNANRPGLNAEIVFKADSIQLIFVGGANYFTLVPEIKTAKNYYTSQSISSLSYYGYAQKKFKNFIVKAGGNYVQNGNNIMMIGGYAVANVTDTAKGYKTYTNLTTATAWLDFQLNVKKWQVGIYGGFAKNLGAEKDINGNRYARGANIDQLYRISPRISYVCDKVTLSTEVEMTTAGYGRPQKDGTVVKTHDAQNIRFLFAAYYNF
ncbi:MAG: hypothetical protein N2449_04550 [Bacteroidales bacterium]|nr:hypothetical protein [Bacteroidales bacterium]